MNKDRLQMYESLTKITIVLCWLSLFSFWAIKRFGGNLFEIMVENQNFIKFSNLVQNTWVKYLVSFFTTMFGNLIMFCAISQTFFFKGNIINTTLVNPLKCSEAVVSLHHRNRIRVHNSTVKTSFKSKREEK